MFLLQQPKDSPSLRKLIKLINVSIPNRVDLIVYGKGLELPAFTAENYFSTIKSSIIKISNVYELLIMEIPYVEISNIIGFLGDEKELYELLNGLESLRISGIIYFCGKNNLKPRTNLISIYNVDQTLCEINLSLSILKSLISYKTERERRLDEQLTDLSDLDDWVKEKAKQFDSSLPILLSPLLISAKSYLEKIGFNVLTYFDNKILGDIQIVYTGADMHTLRPIASSLRTSAKKVKEILIDVDPLIAPIYLSMILFYLKEIRGGL
ncbi:MAG: hypothetical protein QW281_00025 [Saccharolobus sp.]